MNKIKFSKHSIERFRERFPKKIKDNDVFRSIAKLLYSSTEEKRFLNNTSFLSYVYEKHGCDKPMAFFKNDDIIFVCREDTLVTVLYTSQSIFNEQSSSFKSKRK